MVRPGIKPRGQFPFRDGSREDELSQPRRGRAFAEDCTRTMRGLSDSGDEFPDHRFGVVVWVPSEVCSGSGALDEGCGIGEVDPTPVYGGKMQRPCEIGPSSPCRIVRLSA